MNPLKNNEDQKKSNIPPEPLCLFCFPEDVSSISSLKTTYVNVLPKKEPLYRLTRRKFGRHYEDNQKSEETASRKKLEFWQKKRTEARIIRKRMKEPIRNLKCYLLTSVKNDNTKVLPSLFEVLETVKDAWPATPQRNIFPIRQNHQKQDQKAETSVPFKMKEEIQIHLTSPLFNRRFSMPEELMRKYSISQEKSCEECEENKTMEEMSSSSSSTSTTEQEETVRTKKTAASEIQTNFETDRVEKPTEHIDNYKDFERKPKAELPKRVTQTDFYCQGKRFLKVKNIEKSVQVDECSCRTEKSSSTTVSVKEETEESATTESVPSSSPFLIPKCESSSDNLSSESDCMRCTCRDLTSSKETSTDIFHSGKSTLSQTVTDKSSSTQDTTISVRSVSTRGSSASDGSYSTPEKERTSAKETTTTSDYSPRTPKNTMQRKSRKKERFYHQKSCPRYYEARHSRSFNSKRQCDLYSQQVNDIKKTCDSNTEALAETDKLLKKDQELITNYTQAYDESEKTTEDKYKNPKLSQNELYMMRQLRHQKLIEKKFLIPVETEQENLKPVQIIMDDMESTTGETLKISMSDETKFIEENIMIPRYSALPRTLSMVVNTSSADNNSDSDNQSLVDSLEDQPITHVHNLYFDTKKESKPVRGDANTLLMSKQTRRPPKGKAFFVSIKDPYGESEMLPGLQKIPQPPEKIKNQIFERHLSICNKYKHFYENSSKEPKITERKRKTKNTKNESCEKTTKTKKKNLQEDDKKEQKNTKKKQNEDEKFTKKQKEEEKKEKGKTFKRKREMKDYKGRFSSKIPVLVSSRSSSSVEGERNSSRNFMKKEKGTVETTEILEITHSNSEVGLRKPQAVIHPSQLSVETETLHDKNLLSPIVMPPLLPNIRNPSTLGQSCSKSILFTPIRRSPVAKFRQRFEVIPEEKSSSLSSTEEKMAPESKFKNTSTSPLLVENSNPKQSPNSSADDMTSLVAKIKDTQLQNLPYVKSSDDQKIILFSSRPQNSNSSKGRDALIAMNREDFKRLAKGWMNFYKLSENWDNSEDEKMTGRQKIKENIKTSSNKADDLKGEQLKTNQSIVKTKNNENEIPHNKQTKIELENIKPEKAEKTELKSLKSPQIDENIRFHSSNTVLRTKKNISPCDSSKINLPQLTLPKLKEKKGCKSKSTIAALPKVSKSLEDDDDTDSDSTDYMEPPSPRVPPLSLGDFPSDATISSSENEVDEIKPEIKGHQIRSKKKGAINRTKSKENYFQSIRYGKKKSSGWSVTVAGTVELSRSTSDVEMRLSFPVNGGPPTMCQSDSGFAEDSNYSKVRESRQDLDLYTSRQDLPLGSGNMKQKWTVTVKNPNQGETEDHESKPSKDTNLISPNLGPSQNRDSKTVLKIAQMEESVKEIIERKLLAIWPKVQKAIQKEFLSESGRLVTEFQEQWDDACLTVRGTAVVLEKKQKPPSMTERDVTKRYSSRKNTEFFENGQEIDI